MLLIIPVVLLFIVGGIGLFRARPEAEFGKAAPAFDLPRLTGSGTISLADLKGKPAVINFWASWCEPCKTEAPEFAKVSKAFAGQVSFLGVTMLDGKDPALAYTKRYKIGYDNVRDSRGVIAKRYSVTGVPETAFVDASGRLVGKYIGAFTPGRLEDAVTKLLALKPGSLLKLSGTGDSRPVP